MKLLLNASRIIVGLLFIFSGLIKANDPAGLSYKMQEFFEVWGLHGLNNLTLAFAVLMIGFEIIAGVAVLLGWQFPLFSWLLLLLIIFFTFLTGYALFSGKVRECGCFGDCIRLTAGQSFVKDLLLLVLIGFLHLNRRSVKPLLGKISSLLILTMAAFFSFGFQKYVLTYLPVVDCLPYKKGANISESMKIPPGAVPDSTVINFVYTKDGREVEFDAGNFPADFNDSLYKFVKRYDKVIRQGNAQPPIKDFVIISESGADTTRAILERSGRMLIVFARTLPKDPSGWEWAGTLKELRNAAMAKNIPVAWVTADADAVKAGLSAWQLQDMPVWKGDAVAIKTAARVDPTIYLLDRGTVLGKWAAADLGDIKDVLK
jgi:uncharacterized membrane protein YphA (DoxX/SURF4 family)